jgi:hypothetical protein
MAAKLTRLTYKIAIQLYLVAESCTICSSRSRWPVRKLLRMRVTSHVHLRLIDFITRSISICSKVQIIKRLIMQLSTAFCYFLFLKCKHSPQHFVLKENCIWCFVFYFKLWSWGLNTRKLDENMFLRMNIITEFRKVFTSLHSRTSELHCTEMKYFIHVQVKGIVKHDVTLRRPISSTWNVKSLSNRERELWMQLKAVSQYLKNPRINKKLKVLNGYVKV